MAATQPYFLHTLVALYFYRGLPIVLTVYVHDAAFGIAMVPHWLNCVRLDTLVANTWKVHIGPILKLEHCLLIGEAIKQAHP